MGIKLWGGGTCPQCPGASSASDLFTGYSDYIACLADSVTL